MIDEIGNFDDAVTQLEDELGITAEIIEYSRPPSFFGSVFGMISEGMYFMGRGFGDAVTEPKVESGLRIYT